MRAAARIYRRFAGALCVCAFVLPASSARPHQAMPCPPEITTPVHCFAGKDVNGAIYWMAMPQNWNKVLVVHVHGGPRIRLRDMKASAGELRHHAVMVNAGYAWVNSSFRRPGYGVRMAAQDSESARQLFVGRFGKPRRTLVHGQSWGANIAAKMMEIQTPGENGVKPFDGAFLTNGMLAGGTRGYDFRTDLRAVYQYYCNNHPRPNEPQYPLNMGLAAGMTMPIDDLRARIKDCTGAHLKAEERTPQQKRHLANILNVIRISEGSLFAHMAWQTYMFADISHHRMGGRSPFGNMNVRYGGSDNDDELNKGVARYAPDPRAARELAHDADLGGAISGPVLTLHATGDPTAFVEVNAHYRSTVEKAGKGDLLFQAYLNERNHSALPPPVYPAMLDTLVKWIDSGKRPLHEAIQSDCESYRERLGGRCTFKPDFKPMAYDQRVRPR